MTGKLDAATLRWCARQCRKSARGRNLAPILVSFDNAWADVFLERARRAKQSATRKPRGRKK